MEKGKETKGKLTTEPNIQRTSEEERDRLSELPDFVLLHIMNFIDTKDALRTCILSKRWKDLWKHLTTFSFDQSTSLFDERRVVNFNKFVSQVLSCWDGSISLINVRLVIFESIGSQLLNRIMKCVVLHNDAKTMMQKYSSYLILTIPTCNLLNTLVLNYCFLHNDAKILFISNSNLSSLKLKNLKIRDTFQHKVVLSTPNLSSLTVYFFGVSSFTIQPLSSTCNLSCLEEGTIDIATDISHPVLIGWLQVFSNVKILTLSYQTLKLILKVSHFYLFYALFIFIGLILLQQMIDCYDSCLVAIACYKCGFLFVFANESFIFKKLSLIRVLPIPITIETKLDQALSGITIINTIREAYDLHVMRILCDTY
ncbi:FBD-associated F-box protein [Glycine max]|nr:FBD-associated F-box protein [Glycine max]